jgi:hypothetical protein
MNKTNKRIRLTRAMNTAMKFACLAFAAITFNTFSQTNTDSGSARVVLSQTNHLKATVENIDYARRELTLKGPEGNSVQFAVSDAVKNFPQIKKGDEIKIGYYDSVALAIAKPGDLTPTSRSESLITRPAGEKPGGTAVAVSDITATVEDINRDTREVTLKGPLGNVVKVKVDPSVGNLQRIKKGDRITATRTEALAVSVEAPESPSEDVPTKIMPK